MPHFALNTGVLDHFPCFKCKDADFNGVLKAIDLFTLTKIQSHENH
jgi:hypothetical protein